MFVENVSLLFVGGNACLVVGEDGFMCLCVVSMSVLKAAYELPKFCWVGVV